VCDKYEVFIGMRSAMRCATSMRCAKEFSQDLSKKFSDPKFLVSLRLYFFLTNGRWCAGRGGGGK
jgi:hypothetical protein